MDMIEILKAVLFGIVEGITEWLPISSTGHMILLNEFVTLEVSPEFWEMFLVVIQLGAAAVVGLAFDDVLDALFYNPWCVAIALIVFGVAFIVIENRNRNMSPKITQLSEITYQTALMIGVFQLIAAVFPGTSRSGATIVGALMIGVSRTVAAEFTFFLAIPVMLGASLLKVVKFGFAFTESEIVILLVGMAVAFIVSVAVIRFLMGYIKKHNFKVFGWYRIVLGAVVLLYFTLV